MNAPNIPILALTFAYILHIIEEYRGAWLDWAQSISGQLIKNNASKLPKR
jgi:hypothetical protein